MSLQRYCQENGLEELLEQWDPERNGDKSPGTVTYGSHYKAWWRCGCGWRWQAEVKSRTMGCGCPVCSRKQLVPGFNDLATLAPELAAQWHPVKNGALRPSDVFSRTRRRVWWRCEKGHEWQAGIASRMSGSGCPVCAGKVTVPGENDMESWYPEIAAQWCQEKNGALTPRDVTPYSNRKVWWRCEKGHLYQAVVAARTERGCGCPYCAGRKVLVGFNDLETVSPKVAAQWHPTLNLPLTPRMVTRGSRKKVWWQCADGHVWKAVIYARTTKNGSPACGCPVCAGKVHLRDNIGRYVGYGDAEAVQPPRITF